MAKPVAKSTTWLPLRKAALDIARHFGRTEEYGKVRIIRGAEAGNVRARGLTADGWEISLLPPVWLQPEIKINWATGKVMWVEVPPGKVLVANVTAYQVDLDQESLIAAGLLPRTVLAKRWRPMR